MAKSVSGSIPSSNGTKVAPSSTCSGNISQKIGSIKSADSLFNKYEQLEPAALVEEAPEEEPLTLIEVKDVSFNYVEKLIFKSCVS